MSQSEFKEQKLSLNLLRKQAPNWAWRFVREFGGGYYVGKNTAATDTVEIRLVTRLNTTYDESSIWYQYWCVDGDDNVWAWLAKNGVQK